MAKLTIDGGRKFKLSQVAKAVYKVLNQKDDLKAEIVQVSAQEIRRLNADTRGVDKVTDVLSYPTLDGIRGKVLSKEEFPTDIDGDSLFIGSIVVCLDKIREQAIEIGHSEERERTYLIIHGLLHLFGYDHMIDEDKKQMREKEKAVLLELGIEE